MKEGRRGKWLSYILTTLWLFSMGLAGFFVPYFTDNISFFKIKSLHVEGLETIPPEVVAEEVRKLKNNWLFINESILHRNLNKVTGNSVASVDINRNFANNGVKMDVIIKERKPLFGVVMDDKMFLFDENGVEFNSPYIQTVPYIVYTHDMEFISDNFQNLKSLIVATGQSIGEIYVTKLNTIVYTKEGVKLTLPPVFLLEENLIKNIVKISKDYNIHMQVKEMEINTEGLVIIRSRKEK